MKITLLKEKLKEGLSAIERISIKSLTLPILNNVLIKTSKNFICLESTNLEIGLRWWILAKIEKEGGISVPSRLFFNFINLLLDDKVDIEVADANLKIKQKNLSTQIKGVSGEEFPIIPHINKCEVATIKAIPFCESLSQIINIPTSSTSRPEISGIYFLLQKNQITIAATDSFRLGEKKNTLENSLNKDYSFILPQKTIREVINIFGEKDDILNIYISQNQVMFESQIKEISHPQVQLISKLIEGEYPNYQEIIPKKFETQVFLKKNDFIDQIKPAALFTKKTNEIKLKVISNKNELEIFSQNPDVGEYRSTILSEITGAATEVSFNYRFLLDGLLNIKNPNIVLGLNGGDGAAAIRLVSGGEDDYIYVVMPMKTSFSS